MGRNVTFRGNMGSRGALTWKSNFSRGPARPAGRPPTLLVSRGPRKGTFEHPHHLLAGDTGKGGGTDDGRVHGCIDGDVDRRHEPQARRCPGAGRRVRVHRRVRRREGPRLRRGSDPAGRQWLDGQIVADGARLRARRPEHREGERQVEGPQGPRGVRRVRREGSVASEHRPDPADMRGGVGGQGDDAAGDRASRARRGAGAMVPRRAPRGLREERRVETRAGRRARRQRERIPRGRRRRPLPPGRHPGPHRPHPTSIGPLRRHQGGIRDAAQATEADHQPHVPRRPRGVHRRRAGGCVQHVEGRVPDGDGPARRRRRRVQLGAIGGAAGDSGRRGVQATAAGSAATVVQDAKGGEGRQGRDQGRGQGGGQGRRGWQGQGRRGRRRD